MYDPETKAFLVFSLDIKWEHSSEMGKFQVNQDGYLQGYYFSKKRKYNTTP